MPAVSVAMPLYNKSAHVEQALTKALEQSFTDFEIVVVDDGSTDDGPEKVRQFADSRLTVITQDNTGPAAARNRALAAARAPLVAFLDADDLWTSDHLRHLTELSWRFPQAALVGNRFVEFETGDLPAPPSAPVDYRLLDDFFAASVSEPRLFFTSSCMVRREEALAVGGFPAGHSRGEDLALWIKLASRYAVAVSSYVGCGYRRTTGALTARSVEQPDISMITLESVIAEHPEWPPLRVHNAREYYHRVALAHCLDCIRAGNKEAAKRFLVASANTKSLRGRWWQARLLVSAPSPLRELAFSLSKHAKAS
jgi:glycosyltransferase involved in cell wall biosynthesis